MTPHGWACLAIACVVFALYLSNRFSIATVSLGVLAVLPLLFGLFPLVSGGQAIDPLRFLDGFSSPALIAICALMAIGHGVVTTGALDPVGRQLAAAMQRAPALAPVAVLLLAALASGVVNDTPVVVLLIPVLMFAAARARIPAVHLLLPMNYAVLIGGMATGIGTSTNLIVLQSASTQGVVLGIFSWVEVVALVSVPAFAYLWLVAPRLMPDAAAAPLAESETLFDGHYTVTADSAWAGKPLRDLLGRLAPSSRLVAVMRNGVALVRFPTLALKPGDELVVRDSIDRLQELGDKLGLSVAPRGDGTQVLVHMILTAASPLIGRPLDRTEIERRHDVSIAGIRRSAADHGPNESMAAGDILLVQGQREQIARLQASGVGLLLDNAMTLPRRSHARRALFVVALVVALAAAKLLPIWLAAMCGLTLMMLLGVLGWREVAQSMSAKVILLVSASLALGDSLQVSGVIDVSAQLLASATRNLSPAWVVALLMLTMGLATNFVSNNAAAAIGTPLALALARTFGEDPEPFVLAVLFGCNLCYLTPMGYQTNLLVMSATGCRFRDFLVVGTPLFVIMWGGLSWVLASRFPA